MVEQVISKKAGILKSLYNIFVIVILLVVLGGAINLYFAVGYLLAILAHEAGHFYFVFLNFAVKIKQAVKTKDLTCKDNAGG